MSRRADRLAAQAALEADWARAEARRLTDTPVPRGVPCPAALGRLCTYWRGSDGLYRCCYCCRLSLRSALLDAERNTP